MLIKLLAKGNFGKKLIKKLNLCSYEELFQLGILQRPHYAYCVYNSAILAKKLGYDRISILEFGVAGGNGLVNLEYHAEQVSNLVGINIEIYGFDTAEGLPKPIDYRDLPYHWQESLFKMDLPALKARLKNANLVLGDVRETTQNFFKKYNPAPIAAILYDLDYYSSTIATLSMFEEDEKFFLPRIYCYLDDITGSDIELYNNYTGVKLAINEFNQNHEKKKFSRAYHLIHREIIKGWYNRIYIYHDFEHSKYNQFIGNTHKTLSLK